MINSFKGKIAHAFSRVEKTKLDASKVHLLDHTPHDLQRLASFQFWNRELYEGTHAIFKRTYARTSRRRWLVVEKTIFRINYDRVLHDKNCGHPSIPQSCNKKQKWTDEDGTQLVTFSVHVTAKDLVRHQLKESIPFNVHACPKKKMRPCDRVGKYAMHKITKLIMSDLYSSVENRFAKAHFHFCKFEYVSEYSRLNCSTMNAQVK